MPIQDPEKHREYRRQYQARWYANNHAKQIEANQRRTKKLLEWFKEFKSTLKCERCGENHPACIDFHHNDPTQKENAIYWGVHHARWGKKKIMAEVAKCTVLCANCHRKHHWEERHGSSTE